MNIATIGIDIAKNVFHIHGVCPEGKIVIARQLRRQQLLPYLQELAPCTVGLEAQAHIIGRVRSLSSVTPCV